MWKSKPSSKGRGLYPINFGHTRLGIIAMELRSDQYEGTVDARRIEAATFPNALA